MKEYYLGLDMGTSSVGWAVTNPQYELLRAKGKDLWGVRLFEEANTSAERRSYRISRRRRQREIARMGLLRELMRWILDFMHGWMIVNFICRSVPKTINSHMHCLQIPDTLIRSTLKSILLSSICGKN